MCIVQVVIMDIAPGEVLESTVEREQQPKTITHNTRRESMAGHLDNRAITPIVARNAKKTRSWKLLCKAISVSVVSWTGSGPTEG